MNEQFTCTFHSPSNFPDIDHALPSYWSQCTCAPLGTETSARFTYKTKSHQQNIAFNRILLLGFISKFTILSVSAIVVILKEM